MAFGLLLILLLSACTDPVKQRETASLTFIQGWFQAASQGSRSEDLCHGLGLLKHKAFSCADMLEAASQINPESREIIALVPQECFSGVCGDFLEVRIRSQDLAGNEVDETALLKQDDGKLRMYWYRTDGLIAQLNAQQPSTEEEKAPEQIAYDEITARYPSLYSYPPCYGARASSTTLVGDLMAKDAMDVHQVDTWAAACGETFCFALVGNKIASLCPKQRTP